MQKVITLNVNGIRASAKKGLFEWLEQQDADFVCLQEVRAHGYQIDDPQFHPAGYHISYVEAEKKGYSGVAIFSKKKPQAIHPKMHFPLSDSEGRFVSAEVDGLLVASIYFPSGTTGDIRQTEKYRFLDFFYEWMLKQQSAYDGLILCGDYNIAHTKKDIKNWRGNQKHSGFLPEERAWMDQLLDEANMVDAFRVVDDRDEQYTWWSNRGQAWQNNTGWRIDYQIVSQNLKEKVSAAEIYKETRFSDHAPLIIEYE